MKKIILTIMLALSCASHLQANKDHFYEQAELAVSQHQRTNVRPYLNASYHVARMFKQFPDPNFYNRVAIMMGFGGKESNFMPDYVNVNVPGIKLGGLPGMHIRHFSIDYGTFGLNQQAVIPTYTVARAIQTGRRMSRSELRQLGLHPDLYVRLKKILIIPQDMDLFKIDLKTAEDAKIKYLEMKQRHLRAKEIHITVPYAEDSQDKIDSILLYRVIEQYDRYLRSWPWRSYDSDAYFICEKIIQQ